MAGCSATRAAENIGRGNITSATQVNLWMASAGHRANILDPALTQIGVGSVWSSTYAYTTVATFIRR
jgi:uncharacterized protein YkwD